MGRRRDIVPDISPSDAAHSLGLDSVAALLDALTRYRAAGFVVPDPDPVTGRFDPVAWERFRRLRNPALFPELTAPTVARNSAVNFKERLEAMRRGAR